ncbi:MAG: hypothetical protein ACR2K0_00385 [Acidimicrobiales bacterium]
MPTENPTRARAKAPALWARFRNHRMTPPSRLGTHFDSTDRSALERRLADSDCFCRDTGLGRMYHRNETSFREISPTDSLHVTLGTGNEVATHVDRHSPLARRQPGGDCRYSPLRVAAHNVSGMAGDLVRMALGRKDPSVDRVQRHGDLVDDEAVVRALNAKEQDGGEGLLAFAAIDVAVLRSSTDERRWDIRLQAQVTGTLDQPRLKAAVQSALAHDEAMARLRSGQPLAGDPLAVRVRLGAGPEGDVVLVDVDHAGDDGVGALRVLHAVTAAYAR